MAKEKKKDPIGLFIPAGMFIGLGIGFLVDQVAMGFFLGLGAGFLIVALVKLLKKKYK